MKKLLVLFILGLSSCQGIDKVQVKLPGIERDLPKFEPTGMLVDKYGSYVAYVYEINGHTVIASYKGGSSVIPKHENKAIKGD